MFLIGPLTRSALADVQAGNYHLTVTSATASGTHTGATPSAGPLSGVLPQMNETQQWWLLLIGLTGLILLTSLTIIWWRNRQLIKEQP
ncbi:cell surface protein [Lactiplantibacillus garii]|uniref:Cell surface protein n=1 Tax=Lactiplantibacillus garii TaxID=2306423 RepID=A0A3R8QQT6_9LACO|nr:cell surface protein [Lactiplantibacillus garii]